jgi:hypothetical protein
MMAERYGDRAWSFQEGNGEPAGDPTEPPLA